MIRYFQLPMMFKPIRLQADMAAVEADEWVPHFNQGYYTGEWSGVSLRSIGGLARQLFADPSKTNFENTPVLARCSYFQSVLAGFECPLEAVRLLKLRAGSRIKEHRDFGLCYEEGEFRVHIPIVTNPEVEFTLEGEKLELNEGEAWYVNFNLPHRIENAGETDRVHLVIDGKVNEWVRNLFAPAIGNVLGNDSGDALHTNIQTAVVEHLEA